MKPSPVLAPACVASSSSLLSAAGPRKPCTRSLRGLPPHAEFCHTLQHKTVDAQQVRRLVKQQFFLHAHETDENKIAKLKKNAMSALTNYVMHISVGYACPAPTRLACCWASAFTSMRVHRLLCMA